MAGTASSPKISEPTWLAVIVITAFPGAPLFIVLVVTPLPVVAVCGSAIDGLLEEYFIDGMSYGETIAVSSMKCFLKNNCLC